MQTSTIPRTTAKTYVPHSGIRGVSVRVEGTDPATVPSVLITRRPSGLWEAWHSDQLNSFTTGSFRQCVTYARRAALRRHAPTITR
ncbi:hypothetical protein EDF35_3840 [Rathayibacter sp. PhB151]|uniref:hypothetical protein n=1 Tax=Rathayibacter sp. PhB151 TaxID=2485189 RepID=UPI001063F635|nr:hypothetical protein [Rathayibacter sp. PhB151]TDX74865.1 hypothetical protein EDF35_3840 [Rathayibacter sp. PhB151]